MLPIRQIANGARRILPGLRPMSAQAGPLVNVAVDDKGIAVVTLQRPPVNSLNLELLQELNKALDDVEKNKSRGMILTSAMPTTFSAGLDIMEMYKPDMSRVKQFWSTLQDVWIKLYGSGFPTAAAINGHAPAGGCLLSMSCEYRAMVGGKYAIGLNETALGMIAPTWFMDTMLNTISVRETEIALTTGKMYSVEEALKVGLIDEVATDKVDAVARCMKFLSRFDKIPPMARNVTKQQLRARSLNRLIKGKEQDLQVFLGSVTNPKVQQGIEMYLSMLKAKAAKK